MQKRKLLITIVAILTISLISLAVTCLAPSEAPTLELEIYDGPDYSESDNMCYYRVEAKTTGMPEPEIEFDDDDNVSLLGSGRVEVGVEVGDTYTLTAAATNSAGTASVSIILEGECGEESADADADADADTDDDADVVKEAPTISLAIYEGPLPIESVCVYRIEATVTGSPTPSSVSWSKDDSLGSFGNKKAQVNINNPGDTYTLTATVSNSEGSDTASIDLNWGCPVPTPDPIETDVEIDVNKSISGYIIVQHNAFQNPPVYTFVGDYNNNRQIKAFLSFNINSISGLEDVTIKDASLSMPVDGIVGHPETMPAVHVKTFDFGDSLTLADQGAGGDFVGNFPTSSTMTSFNFSTAQLEGALQDAVDSNSQRFQLKISLSGINADNANDWYRFRLGDISLHVKYEVPG